MEFVLRPGGVIIRRHVSESEVAVPDNLLSAINKDVSVPLRAVVRIDQWGDVSLMVGGARLHHATVPVSRIILRTAFELYDKDKKIFTPDFGSSDPAMELAWKPPEQMQVLILMVVQCHKDSDFSVPKAYLYAQDEEKRQYWKLPLSNIFEDGGICEGRNISHHPTMMSAVIDMLQTFDRSRWNRDLWMDKEATQAMFRFQSNGEKEFNQLPPMGKNWTKLCTKIVTEIQKNIVL